MLPIPPSLAFAFILALMPAAAAWWTARAVLARTSDPALPELLLARRRRLAVFAAVGVVTLALLCSEQTPWAIPLLWIALVLSARPVRRALFGERLGTLAFLRYSISSTIGALGVLLLAAAAPPIAVFFALGIAPDDHAAAVRAAAWLGGALALIVSLWQYYYSRVYLALNHASPLQRSAPAALMARLDAVIERASPKLRVRPAVYRFGAPGAYVMNAVAIPSLSHPAVALGDTLLATLSDDEIVAVFAHEVAHHEQFSAARRGYKWLRLLALVVLIGVMPAVLVYGDSRTAETLSWFVPVFIFVSFGKRAVKRRGAETASDRRAVELTDGDPEALVRALTKIHVYSRVPRRWPYAVERGATHPSLARRIQALRAMSKPAEPAETPVAGPVAAFRAQGQRAVVAFAGDRAYWFDGVPAETPLELHVLREAASSYRAMAYGELTELHLGVDDGSRVVEAVDGAGVRWCVALAPEDVPAVQAALDRIDGKLGHRRVAAPVGVTHVRWLALALLVALGAAGDLGFALLPIALVLVRPTLGAAAASAAAIGIARVLLALPAIVWASPTRQVALLATLGISVMLAFQSVRQARIESARGYARRLKREGLLVAGGAGVVAMVVAASLWPRIVGRPSSLVAHPMAVLLATVLFVAGASLLTIPDRRWRTSGALVSAAAFAGGVVVSGDGWLIHRTPALSWSTRRLIVDGTVRIAGGGATLVASPVGKTFAVRQYRGRAEGAAQYAIGRFGATPAVVRRSSAADLAFLDDDNLLVLDTASADSLEVRGELVPPDAHGGATILWRERIASLSAPRLLLDRARGTWRVIGGDPNRSGFLVATDTIGGSRPRVVSAGSMEADARDDGMTQPLAAFDDGGVLWMTLPRARSDVGTWAQFLFEMSGLRWEIRGSDSGSNRAAQRFLADVNEFPQCATELDRRGVVCVDQSVNGSTVWLAPSAKMLSRVAVLPPVFDMVHADGSDVIAAAERTGDRAAVVDVMRRRGYRVTLPAGPVARDGMRWKNDVLARGDYLFVLSGAGAAATVTRYSIR